MEQTSALQALENGNVTSHCGGYPGESAHNRLITIKAAAAPECPKSAALLNNNILGKHYSHVELYQKTLLCECSSYVISY